MNILAAAVAKVVISLIVTTSDGNEYEVQSWEATSTKEARAELKNCQGVASDLSAIGLKAECKTQPVQLDTATFQTISF